MKTLKSVIKSYAKADLSGIMVFSSEDIYLLEGLDFYGVKDAFDNLPKELLNKKVLWFETDPNGTLGIGYQA